MILTLAHDGQVFKCSSRWALAGLELETDPRREHTSGAFELMRNLLCRSGQR